MITPIKIEAYLKDKQLNNIINSDNTMRSYQARLIAWCEFCDDNSKGMAIHDIAESYLKKLATKYSSVQVKNTLYILKSFYDWINDDNIGGNNPFKMLANKYRVNKKETHIKKMERDNRVLHPSEIAGLKIYSEKVFQDINAYEDPIGYYLAYRNWFIVGMMSEYGIRIGGLCGVNTNDIDFSRRYMTIYDSKNGEPYPIPIKTKISFLRSYLNVRNRFLKAIGIDNEILLLSKTGKRLSDTAARRAINRTADAINLYDSGRSTHQLRHYRATQYYKDNMPLDLISTIMGVSVPVLKRTYLHLTDEDTVRQYEGWLDSVENKFGFVCPKCGYSGETITEKVTLKLVK